MIVEDRKAVVGELVRVYPREVVLEKLEQAYREEIGRLIEEIGGLLPSYRTQVDEATYLRYRDGFLALVARSCEETLSFRDLERLLECLLCRVVVVTAFDESPEPDGVLAGAW